MKSSTLLRSIALPACCGALVALASCAPTQRANSYNANHGPVVFTLPSGQPALNSASPGARIYRAERAAAAASEASSSSAPTLEQAIQEAEWRKLGVTPGSEKAKIVRRWVERMNSDPDVSRFLGKGPSHGSLFSLPPQLRTELFTEGLLRLSPEQRSRMAELMQRVLDNAPADCGGLKDMGAVVSRYLSLATLTDADVDAYFGLVFAMLKQTALQAPLAHVTADERKLGEAGVYRTLKDMLKNDPEGTRVIAAALVDEKGVSPEIWCKAMRIYGKALLATPQPYRDWSMIRAGSDVKSRTEPAPAPQPAAPAGSERGVQPDDSFASRVQRRVKPNVVWAGQAADLETAVEVHCFPNGEIVSARVLRASGDASWDGAALRAVLRSEPMPADASGQAPRQFVITLRPR